jgi:hypothetical protein
VHNAHAGVPGGTVNFRGTERFQLLRCIGRGGMGIVYEALDLSSDTRVALKLLPMVEGELLLRFKNEFRALADLHHPNLVRLGELIATGEQWFFTMELVAGVGFLDYVWRAERSPEAAPGQGTPSAWTAWGTPTSPDEQLTRPQVLDPTNERAPPPRRELDLHRLRAALAQLCRGLQALHGAGKVHRDIKPPNILVTPEERLVLLDFGLASDQVREQTLVGSGTPSYMAPEQASPGRVGPAADWYSVGVLLYEALTGRRPFDGPAHEILYRKQRVDPPPVRAAAPEVPADLEALCMALLRRAPAARPTGAEILRRLLGQQDEALAGVPAAAPASDGPGHEGGPRLAPAGAGPADGPLPGPALVGREQELEILRGAFEDIRGDTPVVVTVQGESGVGKTVLVRQFTDELAATGGALVLSGRCYERESVPYKAFDGVVDALSRHLARLPRPEVMRLLPERAILLAHVFPVLRRIGALATTPDTAHLGLDPLELRARVFAAARELLGRLARRGPLVILIDDLHWADTDSRLLLSELLRGPDTPPLLLVLTTREAPPLLPAALDVRRLDLPNLAPEAARRLATALLRWGPALGQHPPPRLVGAAGPDLDAEAIAVEAGGHPLYIQELARHAVAHGRQRAPSRLDDVLGGRVEALEPAARLLVELVATAGAPLAQEVAAEAAGLERAEFVRQVTSLRTAHLLRTRGPRWSDGVEVYHDRVRQAVWQRIDGERRREHQARLARALEGRSDPATLAMHWREAGNKEKAGHYAALAGDQAASALAFERAADHYQQALSLRPWEVEEARSLRVRLGDALANAGQGAAAGRLFLQTAEGAGPADALELQRRGAEQLLRSGHLDEGLAAVRVALAAAGMKLAATPRRALASLLVERAKLRLGRVRFRERDPSEVSARDLARIDLCWSLSSGLALTDHVQGALFQARSLRLSLRAGEAYRVARGLAAEAAFAATRGRRGLVQNQRLMATAESIARRLGHPHALGMVALTTGVSCHLLGRFAAEQVHLEEAERLFRDRCTGVTWELDAARQFRLENLVYLGELADLARAVPAALKDAADRGDLYAAATFRTGWTNLAWLAGDDPARARQEALWALERWSHQGFHLQHWYGFFAQLQVELYQGEAEAAERRVAEVWRSLEASLLLRIQHCRVIALHARARVALAVAARRPARRAERLAAAAADARRLRRERMPWAVALANLVDAGAAHLRGRPDDARTSLASAAAGLEATDLRLFATAARHRLGMLRGGEEGGALVASAQAGLAAQEVKNPPRMLDLLAPGFEGA